MKQYRAGYHFETVAIYVMNPPTCGYINKSRYVLLESCLLTKWLDAIPLIAIDVKTIASKLIESHFCVWCPNSAP